jgi:peroxiredoxin
MAAILQLRRGSTTPTSLEVSELFYNSTLTTLQVGKSSASNDNITLVKLTETNNGNLQIVGTISGSTLNIAGNAKIGGNIEIGGNIVLGTGSNDTITVNAPFTGSLIPQFDGIDDLGASDKKWKNLYAVSASIDSILVPGSGILSSSDTSFASYTGSINDKNLTLANYTTSVDSKFVAVSVSTSSLNEYTSSQNTKNSTLAIYTASLDTKNSTLEIYTASLETKNSTLAIYTASIDTKWSTLLNVTESILSATASLNSYTQSQDTKNSTLAIYTGSIDTKWETLLNVTSSVLSATASLNSYTSSQDTKNSTLANYTSSLDTKNSTLALLTSSLLLFTASEESKNTTLAIYTASIDTKWETLLNVTSSVLLYTQSLKDAITVTGQDGSSITTIKGNLVVQGTQTSINSTAIVLGDNIIELNGTGVANGGLLVKDPTGASEISGSLLWDSTNDYWKGGKLNDESKILLAGGDGIVSSSAQVTSLLPSGVVSGSQQVTSSLDNRYLMIDGDSVVSSSAQIVNILNDLNSYTSSQDTKNLTLGNYTSSLDTKNLTLQNLTGSFATTGSNTFKGEQIISSSLIVTNEIKGIGNIFLQPDVNDARYFQIYNTAAPSGNDIHFKGNTDFNYFGDDTNYLKIDDSAQTVSIVGVNGVFVGSSLNVTGAVSASAGFTGSIIGEINATNGVVSGSSQVVYTALTSIPAGIVSGSSQIPSLLPTGVVSGSQQLTSSYDLRYAPSASFATLLGANTLASLGSAAFYNVSSSIADGNPNTLGNAFAIKEYVDDAMVLAGAGDITAVNSGNGLSGGAEFGAVTLTLDTGSAHFTNGVDARLIPLTSLNSYTSSQDTKNSTLAIYTASIDSHISNLNSATSSYETNGRGIVSGSSQVTPLLPTGTVSGSSQIFGGSGLVSGSSQIIYADISSIPAGIISGSSQLSGTTITDLTIVNLTTINETASVIFSSGSNRFGDFGNDTHEFTGSVQITGSLTTIGDVIATSFNGVINATNGVISGSSQLTATLPSGVVSGSSQVTKTLQEVTTAGASTSTAITITNATASTDKTTGAFIVTGGIGVSGGINAGGDIVAFASSDIRLKNNIKPIESPLEKISKINGCEFEWNDELQSIYSGKDYGVIAQEIEEVFPELVQTRENGYKAVKYDKLVSVLIEGIKELTKQVEYLKTKIEN